MYEVLRCMRHRKTVSTDVASFRVLCATTMRFKVLRYSKYALYGLPDTLELCRRIKIKKYSVSDF
jgi:hypothetical protein